MWKSDESQRMVWNSSEYVGDSHETLFGKVVVYTVVKSVESTKKSKDIYRSIF